MSKPGARKEAIKIYQDFAQEVENAAKAVMNDIHTALPGKIVSFDPAKGVASVQPKGRYITVDGASLEYPVISDVPVVFPYCQYFNMGMAFPVRPNDNCLIIISEVELDEWRSGAKSEAPLRYDLTSAIAIPGIVLGGASAVQEAVEKEAVIIISGKSKIVVANGKIDITGEINFHGDIFIDGMLNIGGINLNHHKHTSALPGQKTGGPENG